MMTFHLRTVLATLAIASHLISALRAEPVRPNIILVMADDQGWGQVGYYDHPDLKTPNMDAMADHGLRFDRFYAGAPVCSPTRASVLTGRSNDRTGAISHGYALRRQERTIAQILSTVGYETAHFGKWHLNGLRGPGVPLLADDPYHPGHFGFQHWLTTSNFFDLNPLLSREGEFESFKGDSSEVVVEQALAFIRHREDTTKPFFAVIWFGTPHSPFVADDEDAAPFARYPAHKKNQYGEIIAMDRSIGTLRAQLRELGLAENTLVWFCSDNGGLREMGPETVNGLRGFKGDLYEGGIRVPAIIEWPAMIPSPRVTRAPAVTMDILPTMIDLLDLKLASDHPRLDGVSLRPLMAGGAFVRGKPIPFRHIGRGALVDGKYKLISQDYAKGRFELYDLEKDAAETTNIIKQQPKVAKRLIAEFTAWSAEVDRSDAGLDYPEQHLTRPDPEPIQWTDSACYAPYLKVWLTRREYGDWIKRRRKGK